MYLCIKYAARTLMVCDLSDSGFAKHNRFLLINMKTHSLSRLIMVLAITVSSVYDANAKLTFTEKLRKKATVILNQDKTIDLLVNGREPDINVVLHDTISKPEKATKHDFNTKGQPSSVVSDKKPSTGSVKNYHYGQGYRVKFFTGGSTRTDKELAQRKGREFKNCFPHISVYMHFVSPHWICTAGDFQTQTEAYEFIKEIRGTGLVQTSEMIVVKSRIKIYNN